MPILQKQMSFTFTFTFTITIHACFIFILLLPHVRSSPEQAKSAGKHMNNKPDNNHKLNPELSSEIILHGFLLWSSIGFLMPVGILTIRMSNTEQSRTKLKILYYLHAISQTLSILLVTAGAVLSLRNFDNSFYNNHQRIGVALYGVVWFQALIGFLRPKSGTKGRSIWFFVHWVLGTSISLLGIINIYTGLQAYHKKTSSNIYLWSILFTCEVASMIFFYLFQDKWEYIQKQGMISGTELPIRPTTAQEISSKDNKIEQN